VGAFTAVLSVFDEIQSDEEERIAQTIIRSRFGNDDMLQWPRYVLICKFPLYRVVSRKSTPVDINLHWVREGESAYFHDRVGEDWVRWCNAGTTCQSCQETQIWNKAPNEKTGQQPHNRHARTQK
jgi:hypothetical protein